jgi:hypothetical protein
MREAGQIFDGWLPADNYWLVSNRTVAGSLLGTPITGCGHGTEKRKKGKKRDSPREEKK